MILRLLLLLVIGSFVKSFPSPALHGTGNRATVIHDVKNVLTELPSSWETATRQFGRLFQLKSGSMKRSERIQRIVVSLLFLALSKSIVLASPLFFRALIDKDFHQYFSSTKALYTHMSIMGLVLGLGLSKISSGIVQLTSELILSPATTSAAEALPSEAFSAALSFSSHRNDENDEIKLSTSKSDVQNKESPGKDGRSGFARRALDRGLRASNNLLYRSIFNLLPSFVESICVLILMINKAGITVGVTAAIIAYSFVLLSGFAMNKRLPVLRGALRAEGNANSCAEDAISLAETVATFGAMELEKNRYNQALHDVSLTTIQVRYTFSLLKFMQCLLLGLGSTAITYAAITCTSPYEKNIPGRLVLVQALFAQLCAPLDQVGQQLRDCLSSSEDLRELEGLKILGQQSASSSATTSVSSTSSRTQPKVVVIPQESSASPSSPLHLLVLLQHLVKTSLQQTLPHPLLELRGATFFYPSSSSSSSSSPPSTPIPIPILDDVTVSIPRAGYSVGIVGPSGSGKSTLLRLLLGLESVDDVKTGSSGGLFLGGMDVTAMERFALFATVGQDNDLFGSLSLVDNIRYGTETIRVVGAEEDVAALALAVRDANLGDLIGRLEGGWRASVGPRGRRLSGGERQRVCIARALYRQQIGGGILLLDEATSALDAQSERHVAQALAERVKNGGLTAIIISHRLSTVQYCDEIIVVRNGKVIERGSHVELVQKKEGWYADAWRLQNRSTQTEAQTQTPTQTQTEDPSLVEAA
eukprot:gene3912-7801_t